MPAERFGRFVLGAVALLVTLLFAGIFADLCARGAGRLSLGFLFTAPADAGRAGGIAPILVATGWILAVSLAVTAPLGLGAALLLAEFAPSSGRPGRAIRLGLDLLAGTPSIVFGLFGNAFFGRLLGFGYSILAGGLTLACMSLPLVVRLAEEGLRQVPRELRLAAAALGLSRSAALVRVLLPAAAPALVAALVLGLGRALSETAALLFTSGYVDRMPASILDSGRALSVHVLDLAMNVPGGAPNAAASALVLIGLILCVDVAAAGLARRWLAPEVTA